MSLKKKHKDTIKSLKFDIIKSLITMLGLNYMWKERENHLIRSAITPVVIKLTDEKTNRKWTGLNFF
ncbi:hypothetical protein P4U07_30985 [Bacillus mycoides]|uniref:hypothetical protein n=1 Tax=Bacillus mycoides TaxID=1405 RepID=UPI002E236079|nr:hypothetical protein [Bacillus mycoides]